MVLKLRGLDFWVSYPEKKEAVKIKESEVKKVTDIKEIVQKKMGIPINEQILIYKGKEIMNEEMLEKYEFFGEHKKVTLYRIQKGELKEAILENLGDKVIKIKYSQTEEVILNYTEFAYDEVKSIISYFVPNPRPSYCLMIGNFIIKPH